MSEKENNKKFKKCQVLNCNNKKHARGVCAKHYARKRIRGEFTNKKCIVNQCNAPGVMNKMCIRHYLQIKNHGVISGNPAKGRREPNDFILKGKHIEIVLYDMKNNYAATAIIDRSDLSKAKKHKWHLAPRGYVETRTKNGLLKLHQLIMGAKYIDHKNRNPLDNRKSNLREATQSQQMVNYIRKNKTTGFRGVEKKKNRYTARIRVRGERYNLGTFSTKKEAAKVYNAAALRYHKEFACLNDI